jgi:hypothetical protein
VCDAHTSCCGNREVGIGGLVQLARVLDPVSVRGHLHLQGSRLTCTQGRSVGSPCAYSCLQCEGLDYWVGKLWAGAPRS